ncbi:MAG TPA: hypothetical protein VJU86_20915 [Pyrinomonadaceae bacterium]|nr:hypothetical protein [Pyrinomonadaceae bacterium]
MTKTFRIVIFIFAITIAFSASEVAFAQHEGHTMPGATKPKPKRTVRRKPTKKRRAAPKRVQSSTKVAPVTDQHVHPPAAKEPGVLPPSISPIPSSSPHTHAPDMNMPAVQPGPAPLQMTTPHMHTSPAAAAPTESPTTEKHTQHDPSHAPATTPSSPTAPHTMDHGAPAAEMNMGPLMMMSGDSMSIRVGSRETNGLPMGQMGSGTSWQPSSTRTNMLHRSAGDWLLMFHYNAVVGVNSQGGPRGVTKFESSNWFMPMAFRKVGPGTLELRGMVSLEPFTFPPGGSPLLFQTGETYKGRPIIDAQHPHDLFMELSASYTVPLGERATWFTYFGYPGEPALGPTAFMHRASASENPAAALSHHLQDSSHITFGVLTTGFTYRWFKLEGSVFNGREPDENRYNFEAHPWTSRSARLSFAPNSNWSLQVSHGFLRNPEALEPGDVRRTTASISYNKPLARGYWASSFIWGRNHENHDDEIFNLNGYVGESTVNFLDKNYLYTRLELVDKNQLLRAEDRQKLGIVEHHPSFRIGAYTFGGSRDFYATEKLRVAIGGDVTAYSKPATLDAVYGKNPVSYRMFLRFRPGKMTMGGNTSSHEGMKH